MLVGERMSQPVISVSPETPIHDALAMFKKEHIRRAPVIQDGKMVGIVTETDLLNASPSPVSTLSVWEMNYLLSKVTVSQVMSRQVISVAKDTPIEEAARILADNKLGGLPVLDGGNVVGIITETDLFKSLLELLGGRRPGVRIAVAVPAVKGELSKITTAIFEAGGNIVGIGMKGILGSYGDTAEVVLKVQDVAQDKLVEVLRPVATEIMDVREVQDLGRL